MGEKGSTKNINFMTSGARAALLGHGHIGQIVKMHLFLFSCAKKGTDEGSI